MPNVIFDILRGSPFNLGIVRNICLGGDFSDGVGTPQPWSEPGRLICRIPEYGHNLEGKAAGDK